MSKPSQIRSVGQQSPYLKPLIYGLPGIGKTRLLGSSPKCLVLECGKAETDTCAAAGQDVDVWEIHTRAELTEAYEYFRHEGHKDYEWGWLDGLSPLEGRLMKEQLDLVVAKNPNRSLYIADKAEYQIVQNTIDRFVGYFVDLPMNFGFTAHVMIEQSTKFDQEGDEEQVLQMMPQIQGGRGKLSQKVCGYMNIVGYMDTVTTDEGEVRAMLVRGDGRHVAKDRYDAIGNKSGWMLNPTIPKIQAAVNSALGKGKAKAGGTTKKVVKKAVKATAKKSTGLRAK